MDRPSGRRAECQGIAAFAGCITGRAAGVFASDSFSSCTCATAWQQRKPRSSSPECPSNPDADRRKQHCCGPQSCAAASGLGHRCCDGCSRCFGRGRGHGVCRPWLQQWVGAQPCKRPHCIIAAGVACTVKRTIRPAVSCRSSCIAGCRRLACRCIGRWLCCFVFFLCGSGCIGAEAAGAAQCSGWCSGQACIVSGCCCCVSTRGGSAGWRSRLPCGSSGVNCACPAARTTGAPSSWRCWDSCKANRSCIRSCSFRRRRCYSAAAPCFRFCGSICVCICDGSAAAAVGPYHRGPQSRPARRQGQGQGRRCRHGCSPARVSRV